MKTLRLFTCIVLLFCFMTRGFSQDVRYVETKPNAYLYEVPSYIHFPSEKRKAYSASSMKQKKIKKSSTFQVVDITNLNETPMYDAYVVTIKGKNYIVSESNIVDNDYLNNVNKELSHQFESFNDSLNRYSTKQYSKQLLNIINTRIDSCNKVVSYYRSNKESLIIKRARERVENKINKFTKEYQARRDSYSQWVSTLPLSVQKDANILAIPESYLSVGYFGVCDYNMYLVNLSNKPIKYLTWSGKVKNSVGDYISCEVRHVSSFSGRYTGLCNPYCDDYASWEGILVNGSADEMVLTSIKIVYTDGSVKTIGKQSLDYISRIPNKVFMVDGYSYFGYGMVSSYDDGYNIDDELKNELELSKRNIESELQKELSHQEELLRLYNEAKKIVLTSSNSLLYTYIKRGNVFSALSMDSELKKTGNDFCYACDKEFRINQEFDEFKKNYFYYNY